jgi:hypothetical protein
MKKGGEHAVTVYIARGARVVMARRHNLREIQVSIGGETDSERSSTEEISRRERVALDEIFQGAGCRQTESGIVCRMPRTSTPGA